MSTPTERRYRREARYSTQLRVTVEPATAAALAAEAHAAAEPYPPINGDTWIGPWPDREWLIEGWLPVGRVGMLSGRGVGQTPPKDSKRSQCWSRVRRLFSNGRQEWEKFERRVAKSNGLLLVTECEWSLPCGPVLEGLMQIKPSLLLHPCLYLRVLGLRRLACLGHPSTQA